MLILLVWLAFAGIVAAMANKRGHSGLLFFIVSVVLSPLIGMIIVLVMGNKHHVSIT